MYLSTTESTAFGENYLVAIKATICLKQGTSSSATLFNVYIIDIPFILEKYT